jgi:hypothetical protein
MSDKQNTSDASPERHPDTMDEVIAKIGAINSRGINDRWQVGRRMQQLRAQGEANPGQAIARATGISARAARYYELVSRSFPDPDALEQLTRKGLTWKTLRLLASPLLAPDRDHFLALFEDGKMSSQQLHVHASARCRQIRGRKDKRLLGQVNALIRQSRSTTERLTAIQSELTRPAPTVHAAP